MEITKQPLKISQLENLVNSKERTLSNLEKIFKSRNILKENIRKKITFSKPIIFLNDEPLFYPRTINVLQGKSGTHKSRLAEHICSSLLKKKNFDSELLGLKGNNLENSISVCYVDTERNLSEQYPYSLQQIIKNAGYSDNEEIKNFDFISLIDIERKERFESFREYLETIRNNHKGHIFVILDVLTDLVDNFNDPKPSLQLIDLLNSAINTYDISFLCVIHENPFQEKARGHLGTELLNKSSTALSINYEKDSKGNEQDIIKIQFLKCRSSKKIEPIFVKYSSEKNILIYADKFEIEKVISNKDNKANLFDVSQFIIDNLKAPTKNQELERMLANHFDCTARTIRDRLKDLLNGTAIKTLGYELRKTKMGNSVYYELRKFIPTQQEDIF